MASIPRFLKSKKFWKRMIWFCVVTPILLFSILIFIVYIKQDAIVKDLIKTANEDFTGSIRIKDSHVAPFANFPYISIDIEGLEVYEGKKTNRKERIVYMKDTYVGFNIKDIISGKYTVKSIRLSEGDLRIVQHKDGEFNIVKAFASKKPAKEVKEEFHLDLKSILLDKIDISKLNESNGLLVDAYISKGKTAFKTTDKHLAIDLNTQFELSILSHGDTTFIKHKHFDVNTEIDLNQVNQVLKITETEVQLEGASFGFGGSVDLKNEADLDLHFSGKKPNFDLFLAMAPEEMAPALKEFDNKGQIFFDARVKGKSLNGKQPAITAKFGCKNGYFNNLNSHKKLEKIGFRGSFTNGKNRDLKSMRFELENFSARPEAGKFNGKLVVENFESPEIDMNLVSDFDLDFLAKFVNSKELRGLKGKVLLTMNFHDIIDLSAPEKSIERLNESYFTKLEVKKLRFNSNAFHLPLDNLDLKATLVGHQAKIDHIKLKVGNSDINLKGSISDLPAIIHHTGIQVSTDLTISSNFLDIKQLTSGEKNSKPIDEQIDDLSLKLKFNSSAKALSESKTLPIGEFFIEDLHAKMKHYPHKLHDFHADLFVDENDFRVVDFSGMIDNSDFHFTGRLDNYAIWFEEKIKGNTRVEFDLTSKLLQFDNVFTYGGERFVPKDYRHEEISGLKLHGVTDLHFNDDLKSTDFRLTQFDGKMKVHPLKFEDFSGRVHFENEFLHVEDFKGKLGHSSFDIDLNYNLSKTKNPKHNYVHLKSPRLDVDELMNYNLHSSETAFNQKKVDHDEVFSIYDFELPIMEVKAEIGELDYHKYLLHHFKTDLKTEDQHMIHVNQLDFDAAGGHFAISGYLSGKDKKHIYFKPDIRVRNVDLDKFMLKFDNFGQDHLVAENLHGKFSGKISGKIHLHADLVPKIDDSELTIDMMVLNGRLENYGPILALGDYFEDAKLKSVHFDTLKNVFTLKKSVLTIPKMTINSNLGFMELHGTQKISDKMDMDYVVGVPWKMITQAAGKKLFKRRSSEESSPEELQYKSENSRFVYVKMIGDLENYKISLAKKPK